MIGKNPTLTLFDDTKDLLFKECTDMDKLEPKKSLIDGMIERVVKKTGK